MSCEMKRRDFLKALGIGAGSTVVVASAALAGASPNPDAASAAALEVAKRLEDNASGYYDWTVLNTDYTMYMRQPANRSEDDEPWMRSERAELIHLCDAEKFLDAFHGKRKEELARHCGYIRDAVCTQCGNRVHATV